MGIFKGKAPDPPYGHSSNADQKECRDNGWCWGCGGTGYLGWNFGGEKGQVTCKECGGSGKAS